MHTVVIPWYAFNSYSLVRDGRLGRGAVLNYSLWQAIAWGKAPNLGPETAGGVVAEAFPLGEVVPIVVPGKPTVGVAMQSQP